MLTSPPPYLQAPGQGLKVSTLWQARWDGACSKSRPHFEFALMSGT